MKERFTMKTRERYEIAVRVHIPGEEKPRGVVQILHGMAEHKKRYRDIAGYLKKRGLIVYVHDQRGHGKSQLASLLPGTLGLRNGWENLVSDAMQLNSLIHSRHPELPIVLLGHSMGSTLARECARRYGHKMAGMVLSGPARNPGRAGLPGQWRARAEMILRGHHRPSPSLDRLLFRDANARIPDARTPYDWLSRDTGVVDAYVDDPLCGFVCPASFYYELIRGLRQAWEPDTFAGTPKNLAVFVFGGSEDPIGAYGQAVRETADGYRAAGLRDVTDRVYPGGRHEMLNEINRADVYRDLANWIDGVLAQGEAG